MAYSVVGNSDFRWRECACRLRNCEVGGNKKILQITCGILIVMAFLPGIGHWQHIAFAVLILVVLLPEFIFVRVSSFFASHTSQTNHTQKNNHTSQTNHKNNHTQLYWQKFSYMEPKMKVIMFMIAFATIIACVVSLMYAFGLNYPGKQWYVS